jgi:hypothetical protein
MQSTSPLSPWKTYKRYSDNMKVEARLVSLGGVRMMQVKEPKSENYNCPECKVLLTQGNGLSMPQFLLEPKIFHERHRPSA